MTNDPFATGVLDPTAHHRLLEDAPRVLRRAGLSAAHMPGLWSPLSEACGGTERKWVAGLHTNVDKGILGLLFAGKFKPPVEDRMVALTCCLLRNYVDARMVTLHDVLADAPNPTVMLIPNFHTKGRLRPYEVGNLTDVLVGRYKRGNHTVVGMPSWSEMEADYKDLSQMVAAHYASVKE